MIAGATRIDHCNVAWTGPLRGSVRYRPALFAIASSQSHVIALDARLEGLGVEGVSCLFVLVGVCGVVVAVSVGCV